MKKIIDFCKANFLVAEWTLIYFFVLWAVLSYLFGFDMFSRLHWWKFFHAHLRGFVGMTFGLLVYSAIPLYLATVAIIYRTKKPLFTIPIISKIQEKVKNFFTSTQSESEPESEPEPETDEKSIYPENLPSEMRVPYTRMKQKLSLLGATSTFNQPKTDSEKSANTVSTESSEPESFPIPTDFDIGDTLPDTSVPTFTEINFDEPSTQSENPNSNNENSVTKYFDEHNTEYENYKDFIVTAKYIIYIHSDPDFWILDNDTWFAAGKQHDSPVSELLELAKENNLTPVIYFESTNIMDFEGTIEQLTTSGIKPITNLSELD